MTDFGPRWEAADRLARAIRRRWGSAAGYPVASGRDQSASAVLFDLFGLDIRAASDDLLTLRVTGWDRDLTSRVLASATVAPEALGTVLDHLRTALDALVPDAYRRAYDAVLAGDPRGVRAVPPGSATGPGAVYATADLARLEGQVRQQWPDAVVEVVENDAHQRMLTSRPFGTYRLEIGFEQHLHVACGVFVGRLAVPRVFGRWLQSDPDVHAVALSLAAIDDWYRLGAPPDDILGLPLIEPARP
jgi:hypothetical protein